MITEGPRSATPQNPDLLRWIGIQVLLLVIACGSGRAAPPGSCDDERKVHAASATHRPGASGAACWSRWIFSPPSDMWRPGGLRRGGPRRGRRRLP